MTENLVECWICNLTYDKRKKEQHVCMMQMNCKVCMNIGIFHGINNHDTSIFRWECQACKSKYVPAHLRWFHEHFYHPEYEVPEKEKKKSFFDKIKDRLGIN